MLEHDKILKLIDKKLSALPENDDQKVTKFQALKNLMLDKYNFFFSTIDANIALNILAELGIPKKDQMKVYLTLLEEIRSNQCTLIDDLNTDHSLIK